MTGCPALCQRARFDRNRGRASEIVLPGERVQALRRRGGFAEHTFVHDHGVVPIRRDIPLNRAALVSCAGTIGIGAVTITAQVAVGRTVAVLRCAGIGLNATQGVSFARASRLIAIETLAWSRELGRAFGVTDIVDAPRRRRLTRSSSAASISHLRRSASKSPLHRHSRCSRAAEPRR